MARMAQSAQAQVQRRVSMGKDRPARQGWRNSQTRLAGHRSWARLGSRSSAEREEGSAHGQPQHLVSEAALQQERCCTGDWQEWAGQRELRLVERMSLHRDTYRPTDTGTAEQSRACMR